MTDEAQHRARCFEPQTIADLAADRATLRARVVPLHGAHSFPVNKHTPC